MKALAAAFVLVSGVQAWAAPAKEPASLGGPMDGVWKGELRVGADRHAFLLQLRQQGGWFTGRSWEAVHCEEPVSARTGAPGNVLAGSIGKDGSVRFVVTRRWPLETLSEPAAGWRDTWSQICREEEEMTARWRRARAAERARGPRYDDPRTNRAMSNLRVMTEGREAATRRYCELARRLEEGYTLQLSGALLGKTVRGTYTSSTGFRDAFELRR